MPRKQQIEGGTKNKILEVGRRMFFENGFDGTGIRAVMREVGLDVGAFYYYFKTKDELFDEVLADFFAPYRQDFEHIAKEAHLAPYQAMLRFFQYIYEKVLEFRERYEGRMHCTVRWAIREQTLTVIEPYLEEILNVMVQYGGQALHGDPRHGRFSGPRRRKLPAARGYPMGGLHGERAAANRELRAGHYR